MEGLSAAVDTTHHHHKNIITFQSHSLEINNQGSGGIKLKKIRVKKGLVIQSLLQ